MTVAQDIFHSVGPLITTVVVTHTTSESDLARILEMKPDAIQISYPFVFRRDPGVRIIRAIRPGNPLPEDCDAIVVDASEGAGKHFDRSFARDAVMRSKVPVILAGGLTPENVGEAIREICPYAVDVATGIERSPGIKDPEKIMAFIAAARGG